MEGDSQIYRIVISEKSVFNNSSLRAELQGVIQEVMKAIIRHADLSNATPGDPNKCLGNLLVVCSGKQQVSAIG